jgi:glycosyltransferase involved in cell wall biosynthesis
VNKVVTISPFHANYFDTTYGIKNTTVIDLPVRSEDYLEDVDKDLNQVIFCSIPDRGLVQLAQIWNMISSRVPQATINITSDWRLWDANFNVNYVQRYRILFSGFKNVEYHSAVCRTDLVKIQQRSAIHLYPCTYDELFCIAVAETQYVGCVPVTTHTGALETTNMGYKSDDMNELAEQTVWLLDHPKEHQVQIDLTRQLAANRFSPDRIAALWDTQVFNF